MALAEPLPAITGHLQSASSEERSDGDSAVAGSAPLQQLEMFSSGGVTEDHVERTAQRLCERHGDPRH